MADGGDYLVNYGHSAYLGRFRAPPGMLCSRDDRVVIHSPRGVEVGTVLCNAEGRLSQLVDAEGGTVLRIATAADEQAVVGLLPKAERILHDAQRLADERQLPLALLDAEVFLDGASAVVHGIGWAECDAGPLFDELTHRHGCTVHMLDTSRVPAAAAAEEKGCGKPGCGGGEGGCSSCGTEGGGCSTGSCSRGSVKSAEELTAYFANLRSQMEAQQERVSLH
jgi:hypothetical protein